MLHGINLIPPALADNLRGIKVKPKPEVSVGKLAPAVPDQWYCLQVEIRVWS